MHQGSSLTIPDRGWQRFWRPRTLFSVAMAVTASMFIETGAPVHAESSPSQWVRLADTAPVYELMNNTLYHVPNAQIFLDLGGQWSAVKTLSSLAGYTCGLPMVIPFPTGTVVKVTSQSNTYWVDQGMLHLLANPAVTAAMERQAVGITTIADLQPNWPIGTPLTNPYPFYATGTVLKTPNNSTVYEVVGDVLHPITSWNIFTESGFLASQIVSVSGLPGLPLGNTLSQPYHAFPSGTVLRIRGQAPVYVDQNGSWRHIPSPQTLHALGYHFSEVLTVTSLFGNAIGSTVDAACPTAAASTPSPPSSSVPSPSPSPFPSPPTQSQSSSSDSSAPISGFQSMGFGYFADNMPNGTSSSSYQDLLAHGASLSAINPDWYFVQSSSNGSWTVHDWTTSIPALQGQTNPVVVTQAAQQEHVMVLPTVAIYYNPAAGPLTTATDRQNLVQQLLALVNHHGYNGLTIDFENQGTGGLSVSQASIQYTEFIQQLGTALHVAGKYLMVAVYASSYPTTIYNYAALAPYVNWINIMAYPEHNSATPAGPTQGYPWVQAIVQNALATGINSNQIVLGVAPYGHSWTYTNTGWQGNTYVSDRAIQTYVQEHNITPVWDPRQKALVFTTGPLATTPPAPLAEGSTDSAGVANLQSILNVVLLQYAIAHHQTPPPLLWASGTYGTVTAQDVATFQSDYGLQEVTPGTYGVTTAMVLNQVIALEQIGQTQWWDNTSRSVGDLVQLALQDHLGGIAMWRLPFEGSNYWNTVSGLTSIGQP